MIWLIALNLTASVLSILQIIRANQIWEFLIGVTLLYANVYLVLWGIELYFKGV